MNSFPSLSLFLLIVFNLCNRLQFNNTVSIHLKSDEKVLKNTIPVKIDWKNIGKVNLSANVCYLLYLCKPAFTHTVTYNLLCNISLSCQYSCTLNAISNAWHVILQHRQDSSFEMEGKYVEHPLLKSRNENLLFKEKLHPFFHLLPLSSDLYFTLVGHTLSILLT